MTWLISALEWWFSLFGVTDQAYVWLGITLFATAIGLSILYMVAGIVFGALFGLFKS